MIAVMLAAALATQQPELGSADAVARLLASLKAADPAVCELAGRSLTNGGRWRGGDIDEPMPMPTPTPVPMPMPFAGRGKSVSAPSPRIRSRSGKEWDPGGLAVFRTALRDQSRCIRRIAARVVAHAAADAGRPSRSASASWLSSRAGRADRRPGPDARSRTKSRPGSSEQMFTLPGKVRQCPSRPWNCSREHWTS